MRFSPAFFTLLVACLCCASLPAEEDAKTEHEAQLAAAKKIHDSVQKVRAAGDTAAMVKLLPDVEKIWPHDPQLYFVTMQTAAPLFDGPWRESAENRTAFRALYTQTIAKPVPAGPKQAIPCFEAKWQAVLTCTNFVDESHDQALLLDLAYFVGDVRNRRIPNFSSRVEKFPERARAVLERHGVFTREALVDPAALAEYDDALLENERRRVEAELQLMLFRIDGTLGNRLVRYCGELPADSPQRAEFLEKVGKVAHLTEEERATWK
jgi:hypothetical protein